MTTDSVALTLPTADGQVRKVRAVVVTRTVAYVFVVGMLGFGLLPMIQAVTDRRPLWNIVAGGAALTLISVAFVRLVSDAMRRPWRHRRRRDALLVTAIALILPLTLEPSWQILGFLPVAVAIVTVRPRFALAASATILLAFLAERLALKVPGAGYLTVQDALTGAALAGITLLVAFVEELFANRAEVARLAVDAERTRFARDLHDTLGHNLSAVALKVELAGRLMDIDLARSRAELEGVRDIAQESLRDVRAVVHGYRRGSLERELQGVQSVLVSAGVVCRITPSARNLTAPVEEALAWTVREAATNLLRHSAATSCEIEIRDLGDSVRLSVHNDGAGLTGAADPDPVGGNGLLGLTERLAALGGTLTAAHDRQGNFALTALVPMAGTGRNP